MRDDAPYTDAALDLFGSEFPKRSKEFLEQEKTIRSSLPTIAYTTETKGKSHFRGGQGPTNEVEPPITNGAADTGKPETTRTNRHCITNSSYQSMFKKYMVKSMGINPLGLIVSSAGRLAHFACNWSKFTRDQWVLSTIKGYRMEFPSMPYQLYKAQPPKFNKEQQVLIEQEVQKLKDKGAVAQLKVVPKDSFVSTLFLVPKKDGGQRLAINLKCLNAFVVSPHFKMEPSRASPNEEIG